MIIRTVAIPLAYFPYSSTSRVVHWLTDQHGKVSTLLKSAQRSKSPFLGEYELFNTSELIYYSHRSGLLHTAKECALLHPRPRFRSDWRAMQTASYLTALFNHTTPDESPQPGLFELFEELLNSAEQHGESIAFGHWAELRFCAFHGHTPHLDSCLQCGAENPDFFCVPAGGCICSICAPQAEAPLFNCPADIRAMLRIWQKTEHPYIAARTILSEKQQLQLHQICTAFLEHHFHLNPMHRMALQRTN